MNYYYSQIDDNPLYLFAPPDEIICKNYKIPEYFQENILDLVDDKYKPAYKWLLLGPKRSGSGIHIDPFKTSAWNILFSGHKKWIIINEKIEKSKYAYLKVA